MVVVHQSELTKAIDAIESRFYLDGTAYRGIKLTVGQNACDFPMSKADAAAKLPGLFSAARESAFGKGSETVLDPSVRIAQELKANEFSIDFDPQAQGILAEVSCRVGITTVASAQHALAALPASSCTALATGTVYAHSFQAVF